MNLMSSIARVLAEAFFSGLWQGVVLMGVVAGAMRMVPRLGATARFSVWAVAFVAAMAVPFAHVQGGGTAAGGGVRLGLGWGLAIAGCWALLMVTRSGRLVWQGLRLRRIWMEAIPVEGGEAIAALLTEMPREPMLCTSAAVDAPSVIGFWSPKLLIPAWQMSSLSEVELRQIVLHECEHLRRRDDWINLAQEIGLALFPLNPALLWADRRMGLEREIACDAGVVARTEAPFDYARCLTRLAEQRVGRRSLGLALSAWAGESELGRRVVRLLRPAGSMGRVPMQLCLGLLSVVVAGGSLEMARVPRLVSFANKQPEVAAVMPDEALSAAGRGKMLPVVYREMARVPAMRIGRRKAAIRRLLPAVQTVHVSAMGSGPGMVLTSARMRRAAMADLPEERRAAHLVHAVATEFPVSYAAVPFGDGWLILQL